MEKFAQEMASAKVSYFAIIAQSTCKRTGMTCLL